MILVTLGTQDKDFSRLLKAIDKQIKQKNIKDKVVVQAGHTKYESKNMEIFDYIPMDEFEKLMNECSLLITHGGVGSIISGISKDKVVIAAARLEKYKEHTNDHQEQIIEEFAKENYILELKDFDKLDEVLKEAKTFKGEKYESNTKNMIKLLDEYIEKNDKLSFFMKYQSIMMFFIIMLFAEFIQINTLNLFHKFSLVNPVTYTIGWFISLMLSFILVKDLAFINKGWDSNQSIKELILFSIMKISSYLIGLRVLNLLIDISVFNLQLGVLKVLIFIVINFASYIISKKYIFKENK